MYKPYPEGINHVMKACILHIASNLTNNLLEVDKLLLGDLHFFPTNDNFTLCIEFASNQTGLLEAGFGSINLHTLKERA